jgi:hypothetical protein
LLGTHRLSQEKMGWGRRRLRQRPGLTIEFCLILLSRGLNRSCDSHRNP